MDLSNADDKQAQVTDALLEAHKIPNVPQPPSDYVKLDGGAVFGDERITDAKVRELNGADEEALSRALKSNNIFHFLNVLLECGVASLSGVSDATQVKKALRTLLIGDRDVLAMAIRVATYGNMMAIEEWPCPNCGVPITMDLPLTGPDSEDIIKHKKLETPADSEFEVKLKSGARATCHLTTGEDQLYIWEKDDLTAAERNSRMLTKCLLSYTDKNGVTTDITVWPTKVRDLPIRDRQEILTELVERQPGPQYNSIVFKHEECNTEVTLSLGLVNLFRELFLYL